MMGIQAALVIAQVSTAAPAGAAPVLVEDTLGLSEVVESALRTHPRASGAAAYSVAAESEVGAARSALLPSAAVSGTAVRYEEPMVVAPLHGLDLSDPPRFDETLYQAHASVEYTLFEGGGRAARIRAAAGGAESARAAAAGAREAVIGEAVTSYLEVLTAREVRAAHARQVAALESELERTRLFLSEGSAARVEVLRTESAVAEARAEIESADQRLRLAVYRLARVSGIPSPRVMSEVLTAPPMPADGLPSRDTLLARALRSSPAVAEARGRAAAAGALVDAARASLLPRVSLLGRYSLFGSASTEPELEWQAGLQLSYPIFTGGARGREVERATARAAAAAAEAELAAKQVADAVDGALAAYRSALARLAALESAERSAAEVARIEALSLSEGAGVQTDYLRAAAALLRTRAGVAEARHAAMDARARLARVSGALDLDWVTRWTEEVER